MSKRWRKVLGASVQWARGHRFPLSISALIAALVAATGAVAALPRPLGHDGALQAAQTISIMPVRGVVFIRLPGQKTFVRLDRKRRMPAGTEVETASGEVQLILKAGAPGTFYEGRFIVALPRGQASTVELQLSGGSFKPCGAKRTIAARKPPKRSVRRLWGKAKGAFRTRGRYSSTTVRGTDWLTDDRCDGTLTSVRQGRTLVLDLVENRSIGLRTGQQYLAKAPLEFPLTPERAAPSSIVAGPDGNLWFTEPGAGNIGRSTPKGSVIEFAVPGADEEGNPSPQVIAVGPDRNLWFTDENVARLGRITTAGQISTFAVGAETRGIAAGPDGAMWFTQMSDQIGRITPGGVLTEFDVPLDVAGDAVRIARGPDGNLWFTEFFGNRIGRITPQGVVTEFPLPTEDAFPFGITAGPDGAVWFTESDANRIGRIAPNGTIREFPIPTERSGPMDIALGPDGNLWFTEHLAGNIGRITPAGVVTEIPVPTPSGSPSGISRGPSGTVWFTDESNNNIGCFGC